jgi:hypothetical protein
MTSSIRDYLPDDENRDSDPELLLQRLADARRQMFKDRHQSDIIDDIARICRALATEHEADLEKAVQVSKETNKLPVDIWARQLATDLVDSAESEYEPRYEQVINLIGLYQPKLVASTCKLPKSTSNAATLRSTHLSQPRHDSSRKLRCIGVALWLLLHLLLISLPPLSDQPRQPRIPRIPADLIVRS